MHSSVTKSNRASKIYIYAQIHMYTCIYIYTYTRTYVYMCLAKFKNSVDTLR